MGIQRQRQINQNKNHKTRQSIQLRKIKTKKLNQAGGFKAIEEPHSDEFKKLFIYLTTNLKEFTKQYKTFLKSLPLSTGTGLLAVINATQKLAEQNKKIKYLINIELLNEIAQKLLVSFQITKKEQDGKYKFLNRLADKITNDYLYEGTDIQKEERQKKLELYIDELSNFLNENVFRHVNLTCDFMFVKDFSRFRYTLLNEEEALTKFSTNSSRVSRKSHGLSRHSKREENEEEV